MGLRAESHARLRAPEFGWIVWNAGRGSQSLSSVKSAASWEGQFARMLEIPYFSEAMSKQSISVLTTVNAPYSIELDGVALAHCLANLELAKQYSGQVSSFLGEVPLAQQTAFADEFGIALKNLKAFAADFSKWSGESYHLAA